MAVNKFDNSMLDAGTIGTTANKLLQMDGSAKIPAVDGSLLTGIPSSFTKNASDPALNTNPSGGVGTIWANTTSGEVYCCTDATAGANVWTNVGAGSGNIQTPVAQGTNYGYCVLGWNADALDRYSYSSDGNATDVGGKSAARSNFRGVAGSSSTTHGFCVGSSSLENVMEKFPFATNGTMTDVGNLVVGRSCDDNGNSSVDYGYVGGGDASGATNHIDKWSHISDGNASDVGDLTRATRYTSGQSSATYGYTSGGHPASQNNIDKYSFSADGNATDVADLAVAQYGPSGCASSDYGYVISGNDPVAARTDIEKFSFTTEANAVDVGNLTISVRAATGSLPEIT
jgi:hypothetical protein